MMYLLLLVGFVLLIKGADIFVDGAGGIAEKLKVPSLIIGLTIVSLGTSAPEASVSITASLSGSNNISIGNIIGSNIFNLLMVIGICALISPVVAHKDILKRDMIWNIGITLLLLVFILDSSITRIEGVILVAGIVAYLIVIVRSAMKSRNESTHKRTVSLPKSIIFLILGLAAIIYGGDLVVDNASKIAVSLGMSETLVGLTIIAIGTSLPELVTSVVATRKGDFGIAVGNAVGSCIFNILFILGTVSVIKPLAAASELIIDVSVLAVVTVLMLIFAKTNNKISRQEGIICVLIYVAYSAYIILR